MNFKTILISIFLFATLNVNSQESKNQSIKIGIGAGFSQSENCIGTGTMYSVGYQRDIWKDRLRFNPNLSLGFYSPMFITDQADQYFNSINLNANLNYDLIRIKRFSVVIYAGIEAGKTQGYVGSGGYYDYGGYSGYGNGYGSSNTQNSHYVHDYHLGGNFGGGFRFITKNQKTAVNILPFNFRVGYPEFFEAHLKLEVDIKI
jgi:hypothetical protein